MTNIVLSKQCLSNYGNDRKQIVYADKKLSVRYTEVPSIETACGLVGHTKYCKVAGVIEKYKSSIKRCCDLMYNITKSKIIYPNDEEKYHGDDVLCLFLRDDYPNLCYYNENYIEPTITQTQDGFIISILNHQEI